MKQLIVRMTEADRVQVRQAAQACGVTIADYCRRVLLADARSMTGQAPQDIPSMLAEIHERICGPRNGNGEVEDAVAALLKSGLDERTARQRVGRLAKEEPKADAARLVVLAFRDSEKD